MSWSCGDFWKCERLTEKPCCLKISRSIFHIWIVIAPSRESANLLLWARTVRLSAGGLSLGACTDIAKDSSVARCSKKAAPHRDTGMQGYSLAVAAQPGVLCQDWSDSCLKLTNHVHSVTVDQGSMGNPHNRVCVCVCISSNTYTY